VDLYLFDFDHTLHAYDSRYRLPALAIAAHSSQYRLAKLWWAAGFERRAESGEWSDAEAYLDEFARVTETRRISLEEWAHARMLASTPNRPVIEVLAAVRASGTVSLLSNNPSPFQAALPMMAPEVCALMDGNIVVSAAAGVRKPDARIYEIALARYDAAAENTLFIDDSAENIAGAIAVGIQGHHYDPRSPTRDSDLRAAVAAFQGRAR
jgi:putative hydrolase of the HAD superfamily